MSEASVSTDRTTDLFEVDLAESHDLRVAAIPRDRRIDERRYSVGLENVDRNAYLMHPGEFVVIGAREGEGKTSLCERIAMANAREHRVLFVSLDMRPEIVQDRCLSKLMLTGTEHVHWLEQTVDPKFGDGMRRLAEFDLMVWRPESERESSIDAILRRAEDVSAAILIIDYCRLIYGWEPGTAAARVVNKLRSWTDKSMTTTILLAQLNNDAVNKRPHNGYIQDTTQIAQRADRIMLIYRPYNGRPNKDNIAEIITSKNRIGPKVRNHVGWTGTTMDFYSLTEEEEDQARCCRSSHPS